MTALAQLLADLKAASKGDGYLNARLEVAVFVPDHFSTAKRLNSAGFKVISTYTDRDGAKTHGTAWAADCTTKVDSALRLLTKTLPDHRAVLFTDVNGQPEALLALNDEPVKAVGRAPTLPLALCIAIVEAKIKESEQ